MALEQLIAQLKTNSLAMPSHESVEFKTHKSSRLALVVSMVCGFQNACSWPRAEEITKLCSKLKPWVEYFARTSLYAILTQICPRALYKSQTNLPTSPTSQPTSRCPEISLQVSTWHIFHDKWYRIFSQTGTIELGQVRTWVTTIPRWALPLLWASQSNWNVEHKSY